MSIEVDGIKLELGAKPLKLVKQNDETVQMTVKEAADKIATNELTPEQLMMWSVGGNVG